jgi:hypothetical protein
MQPYCTPRRVSRAQVNCKGNALLLTRELFDDDVNVRNTPAAADAGPQFIGPRGQLVKAESFICVRAATGQSSLALGWLARRMFIKQIVSAIKVSPRALSTEHPSDICTIPSSRSPKAVEWRGVRMKAYMSPGDHIHGWVMSSGFTSASKSSAEIRPRFRAASRRVMWAWWAALATLAALS